MKATDKPRINKAEQAFDAGHKAFHDGLRQQHNPYGARHSLSYLSQYWDMGWLAAQAGKGTYGEGK